MVDESPLVPFEVDPALHDAADDDEIVFFPTYTQGDIGVYRPGLIQLSKRLAAEGVRVRYAHPADKRTWLREYSAETWVDIAIGVGSGVPWFVLQQVLERRKPQRVRLKFTRARKVKGRRMWGAEFIELDGSPAEVAETLRLLEGKQTDE